MNESRTKNSLLNFTSSIGAQLLAVITQFVVRTVFIHTLGENYLGLNGLFSNILSMLSLAEMGVGSAIIYKLYAPVAEHDYKRISVLMKFYKRVYFIIGIVVAIIGVCLIPFLPHLIKNYDRLEQLQINAVLIFMIYLFNSVSSYWFFAYRQAIIRAHQKEYYITVIGYFVTIGFSIVQVIGLLVYPNFILYTGLSVLSTITLNFFSSRLAIKKYPYLLENQQETISKEEKKSIFKDCSALLIYKMNNVVVKSTDNIVISSFLGLGSVASYSNYYIFFTTIRSLYVKIFDSVGHSIGNLHTTHNVRHEYSIFKVMMLLAAIIGGTSLVGIFAVSDEFIRVWIGDKWVIDQPFSLLMGIELFTASFKIILSKYRTTMGLFQQAKYRPIFGMIINLFVSIVLVNSLGVTGVLIGTVISDWTTLLWYDPLIIHRVGFSNCYPVLKYYGKFLLYFGIALSVGFIDSAICNRFFIGYGWTSVIIHALICGLSVPISIVLITYRTEECKYLRDLIFSFVKKLIRRKCN